VEKENKIEESFEPKTSVKRENFEHKNREQKFLLKAFKLEFFCKMIVVITLTLIIPIYRTRIGIKE